MKIKSLFEIVTPENRKLSHLTLITIVIIYVVVVAGGFGWYFRNDSEILDQYPLLILIPLLLQNLLIGFYGSSWHVVGLYSSLSSTLFVLVVTIVEGRTEFEDILSLETTVYVPAFVIVSAMILSLFTFFISRQFRDKTHIRRHINIRWDLWFQWILGNSLGLTIGYIVGNAMGPALEQITFRFAGMILSWTLLGLSVGLTQWFVLRKQVSQAGWWIWTNILGWVVGGSLFNWPILAWPIAWTLIGVMQWLVLRKQVFQAGWWMLAHPVAWIIGWSVGAGVVEILFESPSWPLRWIVIGASAGAFTGIALMSLLRFPISETRNQRIAH